ncbi:MAG: hypothetical protein RLY49_223 [Candidatus Parcubacteria bacterium]|jgi:hypothetical protein
MQVISFFKKNLTKYSHFLLFFALSIFWFFYIEASIKTQWVITFFDPADYIFLAKHFFGMSQGGIVFLPDFNQRWQEFLTLIPFRQIGIGTFYILLEKILGSYAIIWGPAILKTFIAASYAYLCQIWHNKIKSVPSWVCFVVLIFTTTVWVNGNSMWSEPFIRILFVLLLALFIQRIGAQYSTLHFIGALFILFLLLVNIKIQWILLGVPLLLYEAGELILKKKIKQGVITILLTALLPLSVLTINSIGWNYYGIIAGNSLHTILKEESKGSSFLYTICQKEEIIQLSTRFCNEKKYSMNGTWGDFMKYQYPTQDLKELIMAMDTLSKDMVDNSPQAYFKTVKENFSNLTNFPAAKNNEKGIIPTLVDIACIIVSVVGLLNFKTRRIALFCLILWIVPLIGAHVAIWDVRYVTPMAGIPILGAICIMRLYFENKLPPLPNH